ncbi:hypothetical protein QBC34DRAFT_397834 [Podospora aff. communis PSN243]|uniref:MARVEL domain-containing protein n=1 Tax=Podospora aff. communis PSN243 TaxID=3040156 RepID=A0AAV9GY04_9PEZI|nr:hypothetical protein QBC34DRAFT_397834 [Podospora aff. communis PSN243]
MQRTPNEYAKRPNPTPFMYFQLLHCLPERAAAISFIISSIGWLQSMVVQSGFSVLGVAFLAAGVYLASMEAIISLIELGQGNVVQSESRVLSAGSFWALGVVFGVVLAVFLGVALGVALELGVAFELILAMSVCSATMAAITSLIGLGQGNAVQSLESLESDMDAGVVLVRDMMLVVCWRGRILSCDVFWG